MTDGGGPGRGEGRGGEDEEEEKVGGEAKGNLIDEKEKPEKGVAVTEQGM